MNKYILNQDLDQVLVPLLDPPTVLIMTEVNIHYRHTLNHLSRQFRQVKCNFERAFAKKYIWIIRWLIATERITDKQRIFKNACMNGSIDIAKWTIESDVYWKIDIHDKNEFAFRMACEKGYFEIAKWLFDLGQKKYGEINYNSYVLSLVCYNGHFDIARWLVEDCKYIVIPGIKSNLYYLLTGAFKCACFNGHLDIAKWIIELDRMYGSIIFHSREYYSIRDNIGEYVFIQACANGHLALVKYLIKMSEEGISDKINIHTENERPFQYACMNGHIDIAKWLIEIGESTYGKIDIHANNEIAFIWAYYDKHHDITKWLRSLEKTHGKIDFV